MLDQLVASLDGDACDLPDLLIRALEAGADNGEGDARCIDDVGTPSDSAFLQVMNLSGDVVVELAVVDTGEESAVDVLRSMFDEWRAANPCSRPMMCEP